MEVHDPGGNILLGNYYEILKNKRKRKIGKRNKMVKDNACTEEQMFVQMETTAPI